MSAYTYDRYENRTSVASSGREPMVYNYDGLGQLETVVYASGTLTVENFYDANGRLIAETTNRKSSASGITQTNTRDQLSVLPPLMQSLSTKQKTITHRTVPCVHSRCRVLLYAHRLTIDF